MIYLVYNHYSPIYLPNPRIYIKLQQQIVVDICAIQLPEPIIAFDERLRENKQPRQIQIKSCQ